ncbi:hypothetical protein STEG23_021133 [Scotinomys teguina]
MARKAGQGKEEEESRARQQEEKTPVRDEEKTPARHGGGHHVVEQVPGTRSYNIRTWDGGNNKESRHMAHSLWLYLVPLHGDLFHGRLVSSLPAALPWTPPLPFLVPPSGPSPNQYPLFVD